MTGKYLEDLAEAKYKSPSLAEGPCFELEKLPDLASKL
jgi:hypothetical protein